VSHITVFSHIKVHPEDRRRNLLGNLGTVPNAQHPIPKDSITQCHPCNMSNLAFHYRLFDTLLIYSMEQSPSSEANRFSASQEIPRISRKPTVHSRTHNSPAKCHSPEPARSSPYTPTSHFPKFHLVLCVIVVGWPCVLL